MYLLCSQLILGFINKCCILNINIINGILSAKSTESARKNLFINIENSQIPFRKEFKEILFLFELFNVFFNANILSKQAQKLYLYILIKPVANRFLVGLPYPVSTIYIKK